MKKEERMIYYDPYLNLELYEFSGIAQNFQDHFHEEFVIGVILEGSRKFTCEGKVYYLNAGDILIINPREIHSCDHCGKTKLHYFSLNISKNIMKEIVLGITGKAIIPYFTTSVIQQKDLVINLIDLKRMIVQSQHDLASEELFLILMSRLLDEYANINISNKRKGDDFANTRIDNICQYLENNFYRNVSLDELSLLSKLSKYHLIRLFAKERGISPHKYLETVRIEKSKIMLEKNIPIVDIALQMGFTDQSHFSNSFKSLIGLTPKTYQKILRR